MEDYRKINRDQTFTEWYRTVLTQVGTRKKYKSIQKDLVRISFDYYMDIKKIEIAIKIRNIKSTWNETLKIHLEELKSFSFKISEKLETFII